MGYNRYGYVFNNPLRFTDPSGYFASGDTTGKQQNNAESIVIRQAREDQQKERLSYNTDESTDEPGVNQLRVEGGQNGQDGGGFELGPIGLGISIELGWPNWLVGSTFAFGLDFGIVADNTLLGIGVYTTTKKPENNPTSFSIAPEVFYVQTTTANQIKIGGLNGYANEVMGSVGPIGATIGWDNGVNYNMYTISGFARGIDFGYGTWETNTRVYQLGDVAIWWGNLFK